MKGIIVYKGKYGSTHQYASWLRNELELHLAPAENCKKYQLELSDVVIIGSSIYIGKLSIGKWMKNNIDTLRNKKIFLFAVCGTPVSETKKLQTYLESSVPAELLQQCKVYFLPGRLVYKNLSWMDKFMLRMGSMLSKEPEAKNAMLTDYDDVKEENLDELVNDIKTFAAIKAEPVPVLQE
jgi:menaquinone-dependent protoporphyrinogen IX oxidase